MYLLYTKDPMARGNAIMIEIQYEGNIPLFLVESEMGQRFRLLFPELMVRYTSGKAMSYWAWRTKRKELLKDLPNADSTNKERTTYW